VPNEFRDCKRRLCHLWGSSGFRCHSRFFRTNQPGPGGRFSSSDPGSETERMGDMRSAGRLAFRLHPAPDARAVCVSWPTRRSRRELFLPRAFSFSWPGPILFCSPPGGGRSPRLGFIPYAAMSETSSNCWKTITPAGKQVRLSSLIYKAFLSCRGNGVINEAGCWDYLVGMTSGALHVAQVPESGWPCPLPPPLGCNLSTYRKRNRSGGAALLRQSRSALRRS